MIKYKRGLLLVSVLILSSSILSACGEDTSKPTTQSAAVTNQSADQKVDPKEEYVKKINDMDMKNDLETIGTYGLTVKDLDYTNENDMKAISDVHKIGIPKYKNLLSDLNKMSVPPEYKEFHKLLNDVLSNFLETMEEMDQHLKNPQETDHLTKSTAHYVISTESMGQLAKKLPFGELK